MRTLFWLQQHTMTFLLIKETVLTDERVYQLRARLQREDPQAQDRASFEESCRVVTERYVRNVEAILDLAASRGVQVILAAQPVSTAHKNPQYLPLTYREECAALRAKLERGETMSDWEFNLLRHERLMAALKRIAERRDLPWVDNIALIDANRAGLSSWVHLTEQANLEFAGALRDAILPLLPGAAAEPRADAGSRRAED
jgi:hypothetical protein